jgi:hypothetical protein
MHVNFTPFFNTYVWKLGEDGGCCLRCNIWDLKQPKIIEPAKKVARSAHIREQRGMCIIFLFANRDSYNSFDPGLLRTIFHYLQHANMCFSSLGAYSLNMLKVPNFLTNSSFTHTHTYKLLLSWSKVSRQ